MTGKVEAAVIKHDLFSENDHVLAAVSGGADSVCLLHILLQLAQKNKFRLSVAHMNHCIRGKASDDDAMFVKELAGRLNLPYIEGSANVPRLASKDKISLEMAARTARYDFLARSAKKLDCTCVASAHNADDQAETVLLKFFRGAGPRGLSGISYDVTLNDVRIVRPLLDVARKEIMAYLLREGIKWREDASNRDVSFLRNRVRHEVLPFIALQMNPAIKDTLIRTSEIMRQEDLYLEKQARQVFDDCSSIHPSTLNHKPLESLSPAIVRRVIRQWLASMTLPVELITFDAVTGVERLISKKKGSGSIDVGEGWSIRRDYYELILRKGVQVAPRQFKIAIQVPGETVCPDGGIRIEAKVLVGLIKEKPQKAGTLPARASISKTAVGRKKITVRSWKEGDRMKPLGLNGSKKLQDIFVDEKVSKGDRDRIPVFECGGQIVWIPGYRVAKGWELKDDKKPAIQLFVERI